jgi:hypothetical protein
MTETAENQVGDSSDDDAEIQIEGSIENDFGLEDHEDVSDVAELLEAAQGAFDGPEIQPNEIAELPIPRYSDEDLYDLDDGRQTVQQLELTIGEKKHQKL